MLTNGPTVKQILITTMYQSNNVTKAVFISVYRIVGIFFKISSNRHPYAFLSSHKMVVWLINLLLTSKYLSYKLTLKRICKDRNIEKKLLCSFVLFSVCFLYYQLIMIKFLVAQQISCLMSLNQQAKLAMQHGCEASGSDGSCSHN